MAVMGVRGSTPLNDEIELQAQLATLLRLENVGLLLGAGASTGAGGHTMASLWAQFIAAAPAEATWLRDNNFILPEAILADNNTRVTPNVERLADILEIALAEWRREN